MLFLFLISLIWSDTCDLLRCSLQMSLFVRPRSFYVHAQGNKDVLLPLDQPIYQVGTVNVYTTITPVLVIKCHPSDVIRVF